MELELLTSHTGSAQSQVAYLSMHSNLTRLYKLSNATLSWYDKTSTNLIFGIKMVSNTHVEY